MDSRTLWVAVVGVFAVTAYAVLAALQILVLNPLAAVPGMTLDEIRAEAALRGEEMGGVGVVVFLSVGVVLAVVVAAIAVRKGLAPEATALILLSILFWGMPAYFAASFGTGMALADAFGISGADYSRWSLVLYGTSVAAGLAAIVLAVVLARRRDPQHAAAPA
ncbi:hypothetical protein PFZ55_27855 [Streptomyces sp. MS2A]|nr:hypothetical protein [Streptomyces sp. MS2A]